MGFLVQKELEALLVVSITMWSMRNNKIQGYPFKIKKYKDMINKRSFIKIKNKIKNGLILPPL